MYLAKKKPQHISMWGWVDTLNVFDRACADNSNVFSGNRKAPAYFYVGPKGLKWIRKFFIKELTAMA